MIKSISPISFYISNLLVLFVLSCNTKADQKNIQYKDDSSLSFSSASVNYDGLMEYNPFNISVQDEHANPGFAIISYINVGCSVCIDDINKWSEFYGTLKNNNCQIKLIFYSKDKFDYVKYLCESNTIKKFPFPFYLDDKETFSVNNPVFTDSKADKTVLVNGNGSIILTGNPLHSPDIRSEYLNAVQ